MSLPSFPPLVLRTEKGVPLTHSELDQDLKSIRSYCEMLAGVFRVALNSDGTLNPDSVTENSILNRSVTQAKLGSISVFTPKLDTGSTNSLAITITPALSGYLNEQIFFVKALNSNTGAATLNVNAMGEIPIRKRGVVDVEAGDIQSGSLIVVGYFDGVFHLLSGTGASSSSSSSLSGGFSGFQTYNPADISIPPSAPVAATGILTGTANVAELDTVTVDSGGNQRVYRFMDVMVAAYDVQRHATLLATSLANLKAAIDASGTPGVEYFAGTAAHPTVSGSTLTATTLKVVADTAGAAGNDIVTTEVSTNLSWGGARLSGGITDSFVNFTHGFSTSPTDYLPQLINIDADLSFSPGDLVSLDDFTDSLGLPAFTTSVGGVNIKVERHPASIEVGGLGAIDETKWLLRVTASIKTSVATVMFPALDILLRYPQGSFGNGNDLFIINAGISGTTHITKVALSSGNVTRLSNPSSGPNPRACNCAAILRADGTPHAIMSSTTGFYNTPLIQPAGTWQPTQINAGIIGYYQYKPVWIIDSSGISKVYGVTSAYGVDNLTAVRMYEFTMSSSAVVSIGTVDFSSALILNPDGITAANTAFRDLHPSPAGISVMMFQYNKFKKRMYIITNESAFLHIFEMVGTSGYTDPSSIVEWWQDASRYGKLKYVKSLSVSGNGAPIADFNRESISIDIDVVTGSERAIIFTRVGNTTFAGSVTRIPWRE